MNRKKLQSQHSRSGQILWVLLSIITFGIIFGVMYFAYNEIDYYHKENVWQNEVDMPMKKFFIKRQDANVLPNRQSFVLKAEEPEPIPEPELPVVEETNAPPIAPIAPIALP